MAFCVGLTGGIGCGKSSVAQVFAELGAGIIDTDVISHQLVAPDTPALAIIRDVFGNDFLQPDGTLDRAKVRSLIFSDSTAKSKLEAILHPIIKQRVIEEMRLCLAPYAIIVVPLLLESGQYRNLIRRTLVVDCNEHQQVARTMARSDLSANEVASVMASQMDRKTRLGFANDVINNNGQAEKLRPQIIALHLRYLQLAKSCL